MLRIRSIKPEFWRSQDISSLDVEDRLLFIGLWSYVDDNGVGEDRIPMIAADLFADDIERDPAETFARVSRGLANLSEGGQIVRYAVDGRDYFEILRWREHQRIDKPGKSRLPHHGAAGSVIATSSRDTRDTLAPGTGNREQGTGDQGTGISAPAALALAPTHLQFETIWESWPKKTEKDRSEKEYLKHVRSVDGLAEKISRFGRAYAATTEKQFIPSLAAWLHRKRWTDELPTAPSAGTQHPSRADEAQDFISRLEAIDATRGSGEAAGNHQELR